MRKAQLRQSDDDRSSGVGSGVAPTTPRVWVRPEPAASRFSGVWVQPSGQVSTRIAAEPASLATAKTASPSTPGRTASNWLPEEPYTSQLAFLEKAEMASHSSDC